MASMVRIVVNLVVKFGWFVEGPWPRSDIDIDSRRREQALFEIFVGNYRKYEENCVSRNDIRESPPGT